METGGFDVVRADLECSAHEIGCYLEISAEMGSSCVCQHRLDPAFDVRLAPLDLNLTHASLIGYVAVRSRVVQVGFVDREPAIGRLILDGDTARVISGTGEAEFSRGEVHTLIAGDRKEINYWSADVSIGGNIRSGNTDQVDYTARLGAMRRSLKNRVAFDYLGNITTVDDVDTANSHRATLGRHYFLSERLFVNVVKGQWYRDEFQNIKNRYTIGGGLGYEVIDTPRTSWTLGAGPAWQSTQFVSVEPDEEDTTDGFAFNISSF